MDLSKDKKRVFLGFKNVTISYAFVLRKANGYRNYWNILFSNYPAMCFEDRIKYYWQKKRTYFVEFFGFFIYIDVTKNNIVTKHSYICIHFQTNLKETIVSLYGCL